jgi:integrase
MTALRAESATSARALEFLILTAARTGEALGARWSEIDLAERVEDSGRAHESRCRAPRIPGARQGRPLSDMALAMLMRRLGWGDVTVHGFRSTFRDWAAERTTFPREIAEMALAHAVADDTERAYKRSDLFEKRRRLMTRGPPIAPSPRRQPRCSRSGSAALCRS